MDVSLPNSTTSIQSYGELLEKNYLAGLFVKNDHPLLRARTGTDIVLFHRLSGKSLYFRRDVLEAASDVIGTVDNLVEVFERSTSTISLRAWIDFFEVHIFTTGLVYDEYCGDNLIQPSWRSFHATDVGWHLGRRIDSQRLTNRSNETLVLANESIAVCHHVIYMYGQASGVLWRRRYAWLIAQYFGCLRNVQEDVVNLSMCLEKTKLPTRQYGFLMFVLGTANAHNESIVWQSSRQDGDRDDEYYRQNLESLPHVLYAQVMYGLGLAGAINVAPPCHDFDNDGMIYRNDGVAEIIPTCTSHAPHTSLAFAMQFDKEEEDFYEFTSGYVCSDQNQSIESLPFELHEYVVSHPTHILETSRRKKSLVTLTSPNLQDLFGGPLYIGPGHHVILGNMPSGTFCSRNSSFIITHWEPGALTLKSIARANNIGDIVRIRCGASAGRLYQLKSHHFFSEIDSSVNPSTNNRLFQPLNRQADVWYSVPVPLSMEYYRAADPVSKSLGLFLESRDFAISVADAITSSGKQRRPFYVHEWVMRDTWKYVSDAIDAGMSEARDRHLILPSEFPVALLHALLCFCYTGNASLCSRIVGGGEFAEYAIDNDAQFNLDLPFWIPFFKALRDKQGSLKYTKKKMENKQRSKANKFRH